MNDEMKEICDYFEKRGFELVSQPGYKIQIYVRNNLRVKIEDKEENHGP